MLGLAPAVLHLSYLFHRVALLLRDCCQATVCITQVRLLRACVELALGVAMIYILSVLIRVLFLGPVLGNFHIGALLI